MNGRLIYVVGPSGAGKDSVLATARRQAPPTLWFAHRYITRPTDPTENHVALSAAEFSTRRAAGGFSLCWDSHGWSYGIGIEIDTWIRDGIDVVVSGSRGVFAAALTRYPSLPPIRITADTTILPKQPPPSCMRSGEQLAQSLRRQVKQGHGQDDYQHHCGGFAVIEAANILP